MKELSNEIGLLQEMSAEEIGRLQAIGEKRRYEPGAVILHQGQAADAVFVLIDGQVRVTAILSQGDELVGSDEEMLVRLNPGEFFGELSFITGDAPTLSVVAEEASTVIALPHQALRQLIDADAPLCRKLLFAITRTLVGRLRETGRELVLARYFIRGR